MKYTFEILGISPVLYFFNQQQKFIEKTPQLSIEYLGTHKCTLDALIESVEILPNRGWDLERVVDTVIDFWVNNSDSILYWKARLKDAGSENLLVARVADIKALQAEFEALFGKNC
jgi:plasmid maintenance system antidote protein VapI